MSASEEHTEAQIEDGAWKAFASLHPHEAHATWPDRFWGFFQEVRPGKSREFMETMLRETDEKAGQGADALGDVELAPAVGSGIYAETPLDANVVTVRRKMLIRAERGLSKYRVTTERTDLDALQWLQHAQDEAMDLAVYLERLMGDIQKTMPTVETKFIPTASIKRAIGGATPCEIKAK